MILFSILFRSGNGLEVSFALSQGQVSLFIVLYVLSLFSCTPCWLWILMCGPRSLCFLPIRRSGEPRTVFGVELSHVRWSLRVCWSVGFDRCGWSVQCGSRQWQWISGWVAWVWNEYRGVWCLMMQISGLSCWAISEVWSCCNVGEYNWASSVKFRLNVLALWQGLFTNSPSRICFSFLCVLAGTTS